MRRASVKASCAVVALCVLSICTGCLGPNHATARLAHFNNDIDNRWVKQGAFMVMLPGYVGCSVGDMLIFNPILWLTGSHPIDPPTDDSGLQDIGL